jgi:MFS family permease
MSFSLLSVLLFGYSSLMFPIFAGMIGFGFGANLVLYAARTADIYGIERVGVIYPYVSLAYGLSAILGPTFAGICFDLNNTYYIPIATAMLLSVAGALLFFFFGDTKS